METPEDLPTIPLESVGEHTPEKDEHVEVMKNADEVIGLVVNSLEQQRKQLQHAIKRYEERARDPRR